PIDENTLFNRIPYPLEFSVDINSATINGQQFDAAHDDVCPRLGTAEQWIISATNDKHPFHIHVNPFTVVEKDESGKVTSRWKDPVLINGDVADSRTRVWTRFDDFAGRTVLHCHNLEHEDRGMMMAVRIVGKASKVPRCDPKKPLGLINPKATAPNWS